MDQRHAGIGGPPSRRGFAPITLTGIDGGSVYLNQIRLNPSLALQRRVGTGDLRYYFIHLRLSLILIRISIPS